MLKPDGEFVISWRFSVPRGADGFIARAIEEDPTSDLAVNYGWTHNKSEVITREVARSLAKVHGSCGGKGVQEWSFVKGEDGILRDFVAWCTCAQKNGRKLYSGKGAV